eukprot:24104-Eustigmatos_ZCMA.PRE.1
MREGDDLRTSPSVIECTRQPGDISTDPCGAVAMETEGRMSVSMVSACGTAQQHSMYEPSVAAVVGSHP